jgi:hypothetical protein
MDTANRYTFMMTAALQLERYPKAGSAGTTAIIASPTGTARMPVQGSWRPLVDTSILLLRVIEGDHRALSGVHRALGV